MPYSLKYPELALQLQFSSFDAFEPLLQGSFWNAQRKKGWLYSAENEIAEWKATLSLDQTDVLYVYGLGLGHYALALREWLAENKSRHLVFFEDDLAVLDAFAQMPYAKEILDHPQMHLKWVPSPGAWDLILEDCAIEFSYDRIAVSALKAYQKAPLLRKIKLSLLRKTVLWHSLTSENISGHLLHENIIQNLRRIPGCSYVNHWKEALKGTPIIICGAGPSLQKAAEELRRVRAKALIIACGSALSALSHLGIRPHLGIAIDPNGHEFDCLKGCAYRDLPLLFGSRLYPKVFELFDGPFGYIRSGTGSPLEGHVEEELGLNDPFLGYDLGREALSVTTLAVSLAQAWGCNPIVFAGVDLAYGSGKHYAAGVPVAAKLNRNEQRAGEQWVRRKGADGYLVHTLVKWIMEKETLDRYAKNHPQTDFWKASAGGLGFKHIPFRSFEGLFKKLPSADLDEKIQGLMKRTKMNISAGQVEAVLAPVRSSLQKCLEIFQHLQEEDGSSGKAVLYQMDLEEELAYRLVFRSTLGCFERIGQRKDPLSMGEKWKFLEEAARSYLEIF
jgi:hypothetical protein